MALSKSLPMGQIPVGCQLCEGGNKIEWKCTDCNLLMCHRCKGKVHLRIAKDHRIITINEIRGDEDLLDSFVFSDLKCQEHRNQPCSLYCGTCRKVICFKCIVKVHNGHTFVDEEEFDDKKKKLKEGHNKVKRILSKLSSEKEKIMALEETEDSKLKNLKQNILDQKRKLHQAVDEYADYFVQNADQCFRTLKQEEEIKIEKEIKNMHAKNEAFENMISSRDFMQFFRDFDKLNVSLNEDVSQDTMNISSLPSFFPGEVKMLNFGTLEGSKLREHTSRAELKIKNQWTTDLRRIQAIVKCPDGTLLIADNISELLHHIKLEKDNVKVLTSFSIKVFGLVDISGNFLVSTGETKLKLINLKANKITDSVYDIGPSLISRGVHVTKEKTILITARSPGKAFPVTGRRVVVVMDQTGNRLIEYERDRNNKRLFTVPVEVIRTSNGNICVIDRLYEDCRGRVVVIGQEGNTLGIYSGHHDVNTDEIPFKPGGILATPSDNIVVTDLGNSLIHILNKRGDFISQVGVQNMGIKYPHSYALSTYGHFYIGCTSDSSWPETFRAKLYEIKFSGI